MQSLNTLTEKSQKSLNRVMEVGKRQSPEVRLWGAVAASAIVGSVVVAAGAKGALVVLGMLASTPVALTIGALGGGALGWSFMQNQTASATDQFTTAPVITNLTEAAAPTAV